jgi:hypothetical protein
LDAGQACETILDYAQCRRIQVKFFFVMSDHSYEGVWQTTHTRWATLMRNKIPCTAQSLLQLEPAMIQSVVEGRAYKLGQQYVTENRVRIIGADDTEVSGSVLGNTGMHETRIRLKGGTLQTKCTCAADEQPFCRHCCAILLQYHADLAKRGVGPTNGKPEPTVERVLEAEIVDTITAPPPPPRTESAGAGSGLGMGMGMGMGAGGQLREIMLFLDWLQAAIQAYETHQAFPDHQSLGGGEAAKWAQGIQRMESQSRWGEQQIASLQADVQGKDAQVVRLTQDLERMTQEAKSAQSAADNLRRDLSQAQQTIARMTEAEQEHAKAQHQFMSVMEKLQSKGMELDQMAGTLKDVSAAIRSISQSSGS